MLRRKILLFSMLFFLTIEVSLISISTDSILDSAGAAYTLDGNITDSANTTYMNTTKENVTLVIHDVDSGSDVNESNEFTNIDDINRTDMLDYVEIVEVYAIDPSEINFANTTVSAAAKGSELWKCKDWNFSEQRCYGTWLKVMDIIPDERYSFVMTSEYPAFAESAEILDAWSYSSIGGNWAVRVNATSIAGLSMYVRIKNIRNEGVDFTSSSANLDFKKKKIGKYKIKLNNYPIKEIEFNNLSISKKGNLKIDDVLETGEFKNFVEIYAIDPTELNFTNATVKAVAKGTELYKCREWNFTEQRCYGIWTKIMDITPGQNYTFTLTPKDPAFAESLEILNVQSYPTVGGNWIVKFTTTGTANLTITAVNKTTWSNVNENNDLKFLEIKCKNNILNYSWINNSVFIENYSCSETGYETSKVLTSGKHHLEFRFGNDIEYAHNFAEGTPSATLSFFIDSESHYASDGGMSSVASFDEVPIQLNDYGAATEKCELWNCTAWSAGLVDCNPFCRGGWRCIEWNGITCETYECAEWANADTKIDDKRMWYCSGYFDCQTWNSTTNTCELWNCTEWTMGPLEKVDYQCGPPGWDCTSWEGDVCTAWNCTNWTGGAQDKEDHYCGGGWDCTAWENGACEIWNCIEWVDPTPGGDNLGKYDFYCSSWNCSVWDAANERCDFWNCTSRTQGGTLTVDYYCDRWNCTDWDQTYKACQTWDCLQYLSDKGNEIAAYCSGVFNCTVWKTFSYVDWNQSTLDLGSGQQNTGDLTGSANITSIGDNTDVNVSCASGDCNVISQNWVNGTDMTDGENLSDTFNCSDNNAGNFWAVFNVISVEDTPPDQINVSCEIINDPTTTPDNITFDGSDDCNINVSGIVEINASGSTDVNGDNITYVIEAALENTTTVQNTTDVSKAGENSFGTPDTTLSFYMSSGGFFPGDDKNGGISGDDFDECPVELNDYGNTTQKCELWNCTQWYDGADGLEKASYCSGGWNCIDWNSTSCKHWNCTGWTQHGTNNQVPYCSGAWNCTSWNGTVCESWDCTGWGFSLAKADAYCNGIWNCTTWNNNICGNWDCTSWDTALADKDDDYCSGGWNCTAWDSGGNCENWNCTQWTNGEAVDKGDFYCSNGWNCSAWNGIRCSKWDCLTPVGVVSIDYYCEGGWNCSSWNESSKVCEKWDCLTWSSASSDSTESYCLGGYKCSVWKSFTYTTNETNTTYTNYTDVNGDYWNITNISVKIEVDSYNPEASVEQSTNDPDLELDMWNGTAWVTIWTLNLNDTYTGTGLNTTDYNFTLSTTNSAILAAWENSSNQDIRIRGIYMDGYNETTIDEINYTNVWVIIDGRKWIVIGNHTNETTLDWNTSTVPDQECANFRTRAIDLNGSNTTSDYYTRDCCMNIDNTPPTIILISPQNNSKTTDTTPTFTFNVTDNLAAEMNCTLYINETAYGTNDSVQNNTETNITASPALDDGTYSWWINCTDTVGNENKSEVRTITIDIWHIFYGNVSGNITLRNSGVNNAYLWNVAGISGNVYAVSNSNVDWSMLYALGKISNGSDASADFTEADTNLTISNHSTDINYTFSTDGSTPKETTWFEVFGRNITNVPIANSTNSSNFVTGILWQASGSDEEYNGTQDLVFVAKINENAQGRYGVYDYEIRVPYTFDTYKGGSAVYFYIDLK